MKCIIFTSLVYCVHLTCLHALVCFPNYAIDHHVPEHHAQSIAQKSHKVPNACRPAARHPCIISSLPCILLVI